MDALIAGAGLSGCVAALMLRRAGADCVVIERGGPEDFSSAALHAHRFRAEDTDACAALAGVAASRLAQAGRADLLDLLRSKLNDAGLIIWSDRIEIFGEVAGRWSASTRRGASWRFNRAIDASGPSFALAEKAAAFVGTELDVSHLRDAWTYRSWRVDRPARAGWSATLDSGLAFAAPDRGGLIATLAEPSGRETDAEAATARVAEALGLEPAGIEGRGEVYRGSALSRTSGEGPVLRIGDALIRTPPRYGDGLRNALATARLATSEVSDAEAAAALNDLADRIWSGATLAMALETCSGARPDGQTYPLTDLKPVRS